MPVIDFSDPVVFELAQEQVGKAESHGYIAIMPAEGPTMFVGLGDGPPKLSDGAAGHQEVERDRDQPATEWKGGTLIRVSIPLIFDGYRSGRGQQNRLDRLIELGREDEDGNPPRPFKIAGPIPFGGFPYRRWVVDGNPDMGDDLIREAGTGKLLRQSLTWNVKEYVPADRIRIRRRKRGKKGKGRTYTTKRGDTLLKVAARFEERKARIREYARELAKKNDIRDIRKKLEPGTKLRLP